MHSTTIWTFESPAGRLQWPVDFPVTYGNHQETGSGRALEMLEDGIRFLGDKWFAVGDEIDIQFTDLWVQRGETVRWRAVVCESSCGIMRVQILNPTELDHQRTLEAMHNAVLLRYH
ncbi:MAG: hypothetical protein ACE14L_15880 [Terriglobales bacterium]